ncbi:MAG: twin-arginine translocase TatA/TatE family subunit [Bacteroidetes bacterium]|nr:twin-arginine translocase TatA/TatE family subunit [Bacteroidota bacterium]MBU1580063.1 twin-arginine translocase TatA/TatE family subunit [Bacteroidota bacterium]MBU2556185.1 twin-arginine translocase TatA/TatE family subunit [Bacteroidota bacterium]
MMLLFFNFGTGEIFLLLLVLFIVLGPKKLPEVARTLGKTINEMKRASSGFKNEINKEIQRIERDTKVEDFKLGKQKNAKPLIQPLPDEQSVAQGSSTDEADQNETKPAVNN